MRQIEPTKFLTRNRKKIFMSKLKKNSSKKVFFTLNKDGKKTYRPKAYFAQNNANNNTTVRTIKPQNKVPTKIAPKRLPKGSRPKKVAAPSNMAAANARRARMNAMAAKRRARVSPKYEAKSLNKKAPVRKTRAAPEPKRKSPVSPAMRLLLKINAENRRIIARNNALLAKAKRTRKAPMKKINNPFSLLMKSMRARKAAKK
jgi:hypothetical protein